MYIKHESNKQWLQWIKEEAKQNTSNYILSIAAQVIFYKYCRQTFTINLDLTKGENSVSFINYFYLAKKTNYSKTKKEKQKKKKFFLISHKKINTIKNIQNRRKVQW